MGGGGAEGWSAMADGGPAAGSLMPGTDGCTCTALKVHSLKVHM